MPRSTQEQSPTWRRQIATPGWWLFLLVVVVSCSRSGRPVDSKKGPVVLRVGLGPAATTSVEEGVQQLAVILSGEPLIVPSEDAQPHPVLADSWTMSPDGLLVTITLRANAKFQDGSPVVAGTVAGILTKTLPSWMGSIFDDIAAIRAVDDRHVAIQLRRKSNLVIEALEVPIRRAESNGGTGPFIKADAGLTELKANDSYYLGRPAIDQVTLTRYPSIRAAWADLLRDHVDMLYDVSTDAVDSLSGSSNIRLFTFTRHYQYVLALNRNSPTFKDPAIRRALNVAIDRPALVRDALNGYGVASSSPVWPRYWALPKTTPAVPFDPSAAAAALTHTRFVCLVPSQYDRIALVLKQQLAAVGVDMALEQVTADQLANAFVTHRFDALLSELISGPSIARVYRLWHLKGGYDYGFGNTTFDAALDRVRYAANDEEYREAVANLQKVATDDPPAVFLAWSKGIRAVSAKFDVPVEPDRDPLATLRLWRPANGLEYVNRN